MKRFIQIILSVGIVMSASISSFADIIHFWDAIDFSDSEAVADHNFIEQNFVDFLSLLPNANQDNLQDIVNSFLDKANINESTYTFIYNLADRYLNSPDSPMRDEGYYILFLNHAVEKGKLGEADKERAAFRLEMAVKNRPGMIAPDFRLVTREGEEVTFRTLLGDGENIVLFYDPDCNHCEEVMDIITNEPRLKSGRIIAIDSEDDRGSWEKGYDRLPADWFVGFALDPIQDDELYIFSEMPTIYLIDGTGTIIIKEANIENILLLH